MDDEESLRFFAESVLSDMRFFMEFTLSTIRFFPFIEFTLSEILRSLRSLRMTAGERFRVGMTESEGFRMTSERC